MIRAGWAQEDPLFRRVFTTMFIPKATEEQMGWFDELQRMSTSTENAVQSRIARREVNVTSLLPRITAPTLVLQLTSARESAVRTSLPALPRTSSERSLDAGWSSCATRSRRSSA